MNTSHHRSSKHISSITAVLLFLPGLFFSFPCFADTSGKTPAAVQGILDLRQWDFAENGTVALDGEWELFWQQFLLFPKAPQPAGVTPTGYFPLPDYWNNYTVDGVPLPGEGYASFRLRVLLPDIPDTPYALYLQDILTAYNIYINGEKIADTGIPGTSRESSVPDLSSQVVEFMPHEAEMEIVLEVSNFHDRKGGAWESIIFGPAEDIIPQFIKHISTDIFLITGILIIGLYHIGLYLLGRRDTTALYFGLFCLLITLWSISTGERTLYRIFPNLSWAVNLRVEFLAFFLAAPVFLKYLQTLFPEDFFRPILRVYLILGTAFVLTLFLPVRLFAYTVEPCQITIILGGSYSLYILIKAIYHKREGAMILLAGFLVLFAAVLNDIMHTNQIIHTGRITPAGLLAFIFSQAYLIALRSTRMFQTIEAQTVELRETNRAYGRELVERKKLEKNLIESHRRFERSRIGIILGLAKLAEYRDEDTGSHLERIREYSRVLAKALAEQPEYNDYISEGYIEDLYHSSILHDIGKVGVPDSILLKPAKLTDEEFNIIKRHAAIGGDAIANVEAKIDIKSFLTLGKEIAYSHHEKWNGSGYPRGIKGRDIPLSARIVALADVYDALRSERPYKKAFSHEQTRNIILESRGSHFDPDIVDAFLAAEDEFLRINRQFGDS